MLELRERLSRDRDPYKRDVDFNRKTPGPGIPWPSAWPRWQVLRTVVSEHPQGIPSENYDQRCPTLELDYSALHPNLLYALKGLTPPGQDPYGLDGYSKDTRNFMKKMFLRMINATYGPGQKVQSRGCVSQGQGHYFGRTRYSEDKYLDPLIDMFIEKHKWSRTICLGLWQSLMYIDSHIAERFCRTLPTRTFRYWLCTTVSESICVYWGT